MFLIVFFITISVYIHDVGGCAYHSLPVEVEGLNFQESVFSFHCGFRG